MSKIRCYNCGEMGNFAWGCLKPCENANIARENEQNRKLTKMMDLGNNSVCKECAMICMDIYSDDEDKEIMALCTQDSVSMEKRKSQLNRDIPSENVHNISKRHNEINGNDRKMAINKETITVQDPISNDEENELQKAWTMEMLMMDGNISTTQADEEE